MKESILTFSVVLNVKNTTQWEEHRIENLSVQQEQTGMYFGVFYYLGI